MKKESYNVAVVGAGAVGREIVQILRSRQFPLASLQVIGRSAREQDIGGETHSVIAIDDVDWSNFDIALFAGTEGEKGASVQHGWKAVEQGVVVIDNGDDFRMDERVPLVIPEVNSDHLKDHRGFIANPNCSTIQMAAALWPLHRETPLSEVVVSTYQAVSGSGAGGINELKSQVDSASQGRDLEAKQYPLPIFSNLIPSISSLQDEPAGYYKEELKMIRETRKIFAAPDLTISATCVRVPVYNAHSEAITARFTEDFPADKARRLLEEAEGIEVMDDPGRGIFPTPQHASGRDPVYVGRLRQSTLGPKTIEMWVVADNLRKGAALNAVQIAEKMLEMDLL